MIEEIEEIAIDIRLATSEDIDTLTAISLICFPEQLRWKTFKSHNRKWWNLLVDSDFCEIWVCSVCGQIVAYVALITDRIKYEDAWEMQRLGLFDLLYIFVTSPVKSLKRALFKSRLKRNVSMDSDKKSPKDKPKESIYKRIRTQYEKHNPWIGPIAVLPCMRGKGVATKILDYCFIRSKILNYKSVYAIIKQKNIESKGLFEKRGFQVFDKVDFVQFYKKNLDAK